MTLFSVKFYLFKEDIINFKTFLLGENSLICLSNKMPVFIIN